MWNFLLDLVQVNEGIDYSLIVTIVVAYFVFLWFVISIWVFIDAKKRYDSLIIRVLVWLFVLLFGPPALIFYILIRPEHTLEEEYYMNMALSGDRELKPIHFDGEKGFEIALNISVQPREIDADKHKMYMNVEWSPQKVVLSEKTKRREGRFSKTINKYYFIT